ncbi:MAG TPA: B12-binding domain-containing protein [Acidimicrobiales bacterium]|nr:B12-binding domain-containing protein [Acidimicrobiales bacterium]
MDLQTAAAHLGVHYQTAYRWVRDGSLPAVKRGASYEIDEYDLERFRSARAEPVPPPRRSHVRSWAHQVDRLDGFLLEGDELGARQLVDRLREGGIDPVAICEELLAPVLHRIGDSWAAGRVSVAEEHRASAIVDRLLARIAVHPRGRPRGICVVATPVGEEHGIAAAMAALALRADRWQVHHLGTQVPDNDLVALARGITADLVVLSVTTPDARARADDVAAQLTAGGRRVLVGGAGQHLPELLSLARRG